nr:PGC-1 and ERR-induced regulator in muscle protein 1 [Microcebus murinus]XP_012631816.1 PGC-1 and ERR-induced regulator in muscle protein 1 [Microcebus murinus]
MENFQYSVQLSDQDWAEFSATAEECGLLQAGLASGDELPSSDIDQGDSSGPVGLLPLPAGQPACKEEEEEDAATGQAVSRSRCGLVLAPGSAEQTPGTSARPGPRLSLSSGASPPGSALPGPVSSRDDMHRLLRGPAPSVPGEPPGSPGPPGHSTTPQGPPSSPGGPPRSPSRKKRRAAGTKAGGSSGTQGVAPARRGSPPITARPEAGLGPAAPREKGPEVAATLAAGARRDVQGPDSAGARGPASSLDLSTPISTTDLSIPIISTTDLSTPISTTDLSTPISTTDLSIPIISTTDLSTPISTTDLSTPISTTEQGTEQIRMTPRAELHPVSTHAKEAHPDVATAKPDVAVSTPSSDPLPNTALSTPSSEPLLNMALSTPSSNLPPNTALSTPSSEPPPNTALSTPTCKSRLDADLSTAGPGVDAEVAASTCVSAAVLRAALPQSVSEVRSGVGVSTPARGADAAALSPPAAPQPGPGAVETEVVSPGGPRAEPSVKPLAGAPGHLSGQRPSGPVQAPRKKKVRFSVAMPSPEEPGSGGASEHPSPPTAQPPAPRMAPGGHGGPRAWDTVAVGPRPPQPRILKHLPPPPAPSALGTLAPRSCFAVTLPEAYEFFFCDTIEEEEEDAEEGAAASQALAEVQWPDMCEFFFRDCRARKPRPRGCRSPAPPPKKPAPAPPPGEPVPMSIPEAYEHFFGEDGGELGPATPPRLQALETPGSASLGAGPRAPPTPSPTRGQRFGLAVRRAGELRGPLSSFTFSQNDMCLVFVAFATWAVRTSDLHTPDAWKTVLLANIGTISAIRHFRRQVRRGRRSPSPSPSRSPSS